MRHVALHPLCVTIALFNFACADDSSTLDSSIYAAGGAGGTGDGTGDGTADPNAEGDPTDDTNDTNDTDSDEPDDSDTGADDDPIKFDIPEPESPDQEGNPCGVDILFVIDNSGSMSQHKTPIVEAFDTFIYEMIGALAPGTPVHIGVTRATGFFDPGNGSGWTEPACTFGYIDGQWNPPTEVQNGINGQQGRLFETDGKRYFEYEIGDDPGALAQWFETTLADAIAIDLASNTESVVAAAAYPFHPVNAEYNAGFLRDKAVLVLFLLSDAPDSAPLQIPNSEFINMVSAAKSNCGDGCILPTGIIQSACFDNAQNVNTRLTDFMNGFGAPPVALDFFHMQEPPESFTSVLGATLAETIAYTCEYVVPVE